MGEFWVKQGRALAMFKRTSREATTKEVYADEGADLLTPDVCKPSLLVCYQLATIHRGSYAGSEIGRLP